MKNIAFVVGILCATLNLLAQDNRGKQIARAAEEADSGFGHTIVDS